jgi:iron complex outermembrane recepter protein
MRIRNQDKSRFSARNGSFVIAAMGLACSLAAHAQSDSTTPGSTVPGPTAPGSATGAQAAGLEEIVVTSEKHSESSQKAPVAIVALTGVELVDRGITDVRGLESILPGVAIRPESAVSQTFIRGVGSNLDIPYSDTAVSYNLNGVTLPRYATSSVFLDVAQVEELPGPQGTLYGGSAAGGVININTRLPQNDFAGQALIETGTYGLFHGFVAQNAALTDTLSLRAAVDYERHDGYEDRGFDTDDKVNGRLSLLYQPSDTVKISVWGSGFHDGGVTNATVNVPLLDPDNPWYVPKVGPLAGDKINSNNALKNYNNQLFGGRLDWTIDDITLTYTPGFTFVQNPSEYYAAYFPYVAQDLEHQYTQELKLASDPSAKFSWLAGAYYMTNIMSFNTSFAGFLTNEIHQQNSSEAAFGQATYRVTDWLRLIGGARASWDSKDVAGISGAAFSPVQADYTADHRWAHIDWKVGANADVNSTTLVYATVQTGYLPGGYSPLPNTATFNNTVAEEKLLSFTGGFKSRFLDNTLQINDEAFYYNYKNYQVVAVDLTDGLTALYNANKSVIYGDDLSIKYRLTPNDEFDFALGLTSAHYTDFTLPGGGNFGGNQMTDAPNWTISLGAEHDFNLANDALIAVRVQSELNSGYWELYSHDPGTHQSAYTETNVTVTYTPPDGKWSASLWAKNLENSVVLGPAAVGGQPGPASSFISPPRTIGVNFAVNWD